GRSSPDRASSPRHSRALRASIGTCPLAARMPRAMARSKRPPSFGRSAGARLRVILRAGKSNPEFWIALRTRSLLSLTAVSGRPTRAMPGRPLARCASTLTAGASTPPWARLWTLPGDMDHSLTACPPMGLFGGGCCLLGFQFRQPGFQCLKTGAGAGERGHLAVEFLAADQVQLAERTLQQGLALGLDLAAWQRGVAAGDRKS